MHSCPANENFNPLLRILKRSNSLSTLLLLLLPLFSVRTVKDLIPKRSILKRPTTIDKERHPLLLASEHNVRTAALLGR